MSDSTLFVHNGNSFSFQTLSNDSVSREIEQSKRFYEPDLLDYLTTLDIEAGSAIDVGAHIGNHTVFLSKILGLNVMAFEPAPENYKTLRANRDANELENQVSLQNLAVTGPLDAATSEPRYVTLSPAESGDRGSFSSVLEPNEQSFHCRAVALDNYVEYFETRALRLIKIDAEQAEAEIIRGAKTLIRQHFPVLVTEVQSADAFDELLELLEPLGYSVSAIFNATPTLVWRPFMGNRTESAMRAQIVRYAIDKAMEGMKASIALHTAIDDRAREADEDAAISTEEAQDDHVDQITEAADEETVNEADYDRENIVDVGADLAIADSNDPESVDADEASEDESKRSSAA